MLIVRLSTYACYLKNITVFLRKSVTLVMSTAATTHSILTVCVQLSTLTWQQYCWLFLGQHYSH